MVIWLVNFNNGCHLLSCIPSSQKSYTLNKLRILLQSLEAYIELLAVRLQIVQQTDGLDQIMLTTCMIN